MPAGEKPMSLQPEPHLSFDEWLAGERASFDDRYEYVGGEVFTMSGDPALRRHVPGYASHRNRFREGVSCVSEILP